MHEFASQLGNKMAGEKKSRSTKKKSSSGAVDIGTPVTDKKIKSEPNQNDAEEEDTDNDKQVNLSVVSSTGANDDDAETPNGDAEHVPKKHKTSPTHNLPIPTLNIPMPQTQQTENGKEEEDDTPVTEEQLKPKPKRGRSRSRTPEPRSKPSPPTSKASAKTPPKPVNSGKMEIRDEELNDEPLVLSYEERMRLEEETDEVEIANNPAPVANGNTKKKDQGHVSIGAHSNGTKRKADVINDRKPIRQRNPDAILKTYAVNVQSSDGADIYSIVVAENCDDAISLLDERLDGVGITRLDNTKCIMNEIETSDPNVYFLSDI